MFSWVISGLIVLAVLLSPGLITWWIFEDSGMAGFELTGTRGLFGFIAYAALSPIICLACSKILRHVSV